MAISIIRALCVTIIYRLNGEVKEFRRRVIAPLVIERYLKLEASETDGLFVPVGNGQQISAKNIEWFEIIRATDECDCQDQYGDYLT
jgi:hypothetical protein